MTFIAQANNGRKNFKVKLTEQEVVTIFTDAECTQMELARRYGITQATVNHIKHKRTWKWLTDTIQNRL